MSNYLIHPKIIDIIKNKYEIVEIIDLFENINDHEMLSNRIKKYLNFTFNDAQRIIVLHHDIDYYPSLCGDGNLVYNFFSLCAEYSIPLKYIIFLTNHYGINDEISRLSESLCNSTPPKTIYTALWYDYPRDEVFDHVHNNLITDKKYLYCCINNHQKNHRILTLCMLKEHKLDQVGLLSYHFSNPITSFNFNTDNIT